MKKEQVTRKHVQRTLCSEDRAAVAIVGIVMCLPVPSSTLFYVAGRLAVIGMEPDLLYNGVVSR